MPEEGFLFLIVWNSYSLLERHQTKTHDW